jgi:hypothetical protein
MTAIVGKLPLTILILRKFQEGDKFSVTRYQSCFIPVTMKNCHTEEHFELRLKYGSPCIALELTQ